MIAGLSVTILHPATFLSVAMGNRLDLTGDRNNAEKSL